MKLLLRLCVLARHAKILQAEAGGLLVAETGGLLV